MKKSDAKRGACMLRREKRNRLPGPAVVTSAMRSLRCRHTAPWQIIEAIESSMARWAPAMTALKI